MGNKVTKHPSSSAMVSKNAVAKSRPPSLCYLGYSNLLNVGLHVDILMDILISFPKKENKNKCCSCKVLIVMKEVLSSSINVLQPADIKCLAWLGRLGAYRLNWPRELSWNWLKTRSLKTLNQVNLKAE